MLAIIYTYLHKFLEGYIRDCYNFEEGTKLEMEILCFIEYSFLLNVFCNASFLIYRVKVLSHDLLEKVDIFSYKFIIM